MKKFYFFILFSVFCSYGFSQSSILMANSVAEMQNWNKYPTYETYIAMMQKFATDCPSICKLDTIGYSVKKRLLLAVKISDNVNQIESEPQVFLSGQIHGDELIGGILLLRLIDYILSQYNKNQQITDLINNLQIFINPYANPDGTYKNDNSTMLNATRNNANDVDLNRNFPRIDGIETQIEPEIQAMIDYADNHHFVLSLNTHSGAEVVNYPWDDIASLPADNEWWNFVSREFADTVHKYSAPTYLKDLNNGVTNGYQWYGIYGGRQDYMNYYQHCREVTLELSNSKMFSSENIPNAWENTKRSFINYIKQATFGLRGFVTDSVTKEVLDAIVFINNFDNRNSFVYSYPESGEYYRFLHQGIYSVSFSKEGYKTKTFDIQINNYEQQILDVQLVKCDSCSYINSINVPTINKFFIYPNPTTGQLLIAQQSMTEAGKSPTGGADERREVIKNIEIYDIIGKLLQSKIVNLKSSIEIDISHLQSGMYYLKIGNETVKIIKN